MTDELVRVDADFSGVTRAVGEVQASAAVLEQAFQRSFNAIETQIGRAARTGEVSFRSMVDAVIADLSRLAVQSFITQPLEGFFKGLFEFGGARAAGGPVAPGRSYLVGERGPELFTPSGHGSIAASGARGNGRPQVVMNMQVRDAAGFMRSQAQIAALVARAAARGNRGM